MSIQNKNIRQIALVHVVNQRAGSACFVGGKLILSTDDGAPPSAIETAANRLSVLEGCRVDVIQHIVQEDAWFWERVSGYLQACGELQGGVVLEKEIARLHAYDPRGFHPAFPPVLFRKNGGGLPYWDWVTKEWTLRRKYLENLGYMAIDQGTSFRFLSPDGKTSVQSYKSIVAMWDTLMSDVSFDRAG